MKVRVRIKTVEEFLQTIGLEVVAPYVFHIGDSNSAWFNDSMKTLIGNEYIIEEKSKGIFKLRGEDISWTISPWMCSKWEEIDEFEEGDIVRVKNKSSDDWTFGYYLRYDDNLECHVVSYASPLLQKLMESDGDKVLGYAFNICEKVEQNKINEINQQLL